MFWYTDEINGIIVEWINILTVDTEQHWLGWSRGRSGVCWRRRTWVSAFWRRLVGNWRCTTAMQECKKTRKINFDGNRQQNRNEIPAQRNFFEYFFFVWFKARRVDCSGVLGRQGGSLNFFVLLRQPLWRPLRGWPVSQPKGMAVADVLFPPWRRYEPGLKRSIENATFWTTDLTPNPRVKGGNMGI